MKFTRKKWESKFLKRDLYALSIVEEQIHYRATDQISRELSELQRTAPAGLYELELDARYLFLASAIESAGFRLCDSKFQFITLVERDHLPKYVYDLPEQCEIREFVWAELDDVLALNDRHLIQDEQLVSKWKSGFFNRDVAEAWFSAWVRNSLNEGALCAVLIEAGRVRGFFIYSAKGVHREKPIYKGILSCVDPVFRGHNLHLALQEFIFQQMIRDDSFYLDNTTQISNMSIVKNHFLSGRHPANIRLIFMWEKSN